MQDRYIVSRSGAYTTLMIIVIVIATICTFGILLLAWPYFWLHQKRVVNRTAIEYVVGTPRVVFHRGRMLTMDDDTVNVSAIDNIKIDRSVFGSMFGWCNIAMLTRTDVYRISHVDLKQAEAFRNAVTAAGTDAKIAA